MEDAERERMNLLKNELDEVICFNSISNRTFSVDFKENREIYAKR